MTKRLARLQGAYFEVHHNLMVPIYTYARHIDTEEICPKLTIINMSIPQYHQQHPYDHM